jgi:hypothetical protein
MTDEKLHLWAKEFKPNNSKHGFTGYSSEFPTGPNSLTGLSHEIEMGCCCYEWIEQNHEMNI